MKKGNPIILTDGTRNALTEDQKTAYEFLEAARADENPKAGRKARRMLRKAGIYLSRVHGHTGVTTLTPEKERVATDTPKEAEKRVNPVKAKAA